MTYPGGADEAFCAICNSARPPAPVEITESAAQLHTILDSIVKDRRDRAGTDAGGGALDGSGEGGGGKKKKKKKKRILKKDERVELKKLKESIKDIQLKKAVTPQPSPPASSPAQSPSSSAPPSVLASTLSLPPSAVPASGGSMEIPIKNINYIYTRTKKSNTDNNGSTNVDDNTLDIDNNNHIDSEGAADAPIPDSDGDEMHVIDIPRNNRSSDWLKKKARDPNQVIVHDEPASHSSHHHSSSDSNNSQKVTQGHLSSHSNDSGFYSTTNATLSASSSPSASPSRAGADAAVTGLDLGDLKMRDHRSCIAGVREQENDADDEVRVVELSVEGYGGSEVEHV